MRLISEYDLYIFDCDGVILDSNQLKIEAMGKAVTRVCMEQDSIDRCVDYFKNNFGKSRFHHVDVFVNDILNIETTERERLKTLILDDYSTRCKALYLTAEITPHFTRFVDSLEGVKYVASGSEQGELRSVFEARKLTSYFCQVFGSPVKKTVHVANIMKKNSLCRAVMIGDAISDLEAAKENNIDFIFYSPYSNVENKMRALCSQYDYRVIDTFNEAEI